MSQTSNNPPTEQPPDSKPKPPPDPVGPPAPDLEGPDVNGSGKRGESLTIQLRGWKAPAAEGGLRSPFGSFVS